MKQIIYKIVKGLFLWCLNYVYNYIDKDNDGQLSKEELQALYLQLKDLLDKVKKHKK